MSVDAARDGTHVVGMGPVIFFATVFFRFAKQALEIFQAAARPHELVSMGKGLCAVPVRRG